jgi:hypothetical protein
MRTRPIYLHQSAKEIRGMPVLSAFTRIVGDNPRSINNEIVSVDFGLEDDMRRHDVLLVFVVSGLMSDGKVR